MHPTIHFSTFCIRELCDLLYEETHSCGQAETDFSNSGPEYVGLRLDKAIPTLSTYFYVSHRPTDPVF